MKKRMLAWLLACVLIFCTSLSGFSVLAAEKDVSVVVDGKVIQFDVAPRLIGGRTMVPLRAIFEALGATVEWDNDTETVTAFNEVTIVKCTIGSNTMYVNNVAKTIDVAPMMIDSRTLVPARFIAEGFNCKVDWDDENWVVNITSSPIDYSQVEKETDEPEQVVVQPEATKGTRSNPYGAADGAAITYQEWSHKPIRRVAITCTNVIRGAKANSLAYAENRYNDTPSANQEWVFMEFNVRYLFSDAGEDDLLEGSDVIYKDTFFTTSGTSLPAQDMATLGDTYKGYGVFDVEIYPGSSSKVVIGILTDKGVGDILLRVPNKSEGSNTWINCTSGTKSSIPDVSANTSYQPSVTESNNVSYYAGTSLPTYTSVVGEPLKEKVILDDGSPAYIYDYSQEDYVKYVTSLPAYGWEKYKSDTSSGRLTYYMTKGSSLIAVSYAAKYSEVWILTD